MTDRENTTHDNNAGQAGTQAAIDDALNSKIKPQLRPRIKGTPRLLTEWELEDRRQSGYIVKGVVPAGPSVGITFGSWGTFKTYTELDKMAHIANGRSWMDRRVKKTPCVYVPLEGQGGIPSRVEAWRQAMFYRSLNPRFTITADNKFTLEIDPGQSYSCNIHFYMDPINLRAPSDRDKFVSMILDAGLKGCYTNIDTLAQAAAGLEENGSEMGEMLVIAQELSQRIGGPVNFTAHEGKTAGQGVRGWSGIEGALDFALQMKRPDRTRLEATIHVYKFKDGEQGYDLANIYLQKEFVEHDDDGDPIMSLVVAQLHEGQYQNPNMPETRAPTVVTVEDRNAADDVFVLKLAQEDINGSEHKRTSQRQLELTKDVYFAGCQRDPKRERIGSALGRLVTQGLLKYKGKTTFLILPNAEQANAE